MNEEEIEKLKTENQRLKNIIWSLQKQLAKYQKVRKRNYEFERDYLPYPEDDLRDK
jgi:hypothetical protein